MKKYFSNRQGGGNSFMHSAAFSQKEKKGIGNLSRRPENAQNCADKMQSYIRLFVASNKSSNRIFQHDNASIHTAHHTKVCFQGKRWSNEVAS